MWLYDKLIWTVMGYGVEVWGWKEREGIERLHERFLRWILGVEKRTPGYLVREEMQREMMRSRAGRRAWNMEKRLEEGRGNRIAQFCLKEIKDRAVKRKVLSGWERERSQFFDDRGIEVQEWEEKRGRGEIEFEEIDRRDSERQKEERWERIRKARFSKWYGWVKGEGIPEYLEKGWGENRWKRVARCRLGNETLEGRYWEGEERRMCRLCGGEIESWEHLWEKCRTWKEGGGERGWQEVVGMILGDKGEGEKWMREVEEERRVGRSMSEEREREVRNE